MEVEENVRYIEVDLTSNEFDYSGTFQRRQIVDWNKLQYNSTYKSFEYWRDKFPAGFEYLAGFDKIIQNMADKAKSPYEEMMEIILSSNINDETTENGGDDSNLS